MTALVNVEPTPIGGYFDAVYAPKKDAARVFVAKSDTAPAGGYVAMFMLDDWPRFVHFQVDTAEEARDAAEALLERLERDINDPRWSYLVRDVGNHYHREQSMSDEDREWWTRFTRQRTAA